MRHNGEHGHSAEVQIHLVVGGMTLEVERLHGNTITLRNPVDHAPSHAERVMMIDDYEKRRHVELPLGLSRESKTVDLRAAQPERAVT